MAGWPISGGLLVTFQRVPIGLERALEVSNGPVAAAFRTIDS